MRIIKIKIPLNFEVKEVNCYLIKEEPVTLIDPGPYSEFFISFLKEKLKENNIELSDVKRVLLTHGHTDHAGIAGFLQHKYNSEIYIHRFDKEKIILDINEKIEKRKIFLSNLLIKDGFPEEIVNFLINFVGNFYDYVYKAEEIIEIDEGTKIKFENFSLNVSHTPGHTSGHVVFLTENFEIFSGDVLLKDIFVTPILEFDENGNRRKNLISLLSTYKKLRSFINYKWYVAHGDENFDKLNRIKELENKILAYVKKVKENYNPKLNVYKNFKKFYSCNFEKEKLLFYVSFYYGALDYLSLI